MAITHTWNSDSYDRSFSFVWKMAEKVFALLDPQPSEMILDLGCGTGHLTKRIADVGANVYGLDSSSEMLVKAREAYPDITFIQTDAQNFTLNERFDAVFSNAALHWMSDAEGVVTSVSRILKPGGRFVAEFAGRGNVGKIFGQLDHILEEMGKRVEPDVNPRFTPTIAEYSSLLEKHGLETIFATMTERPTPLEGGEIGLRMWLDQFAKAYYDELDPEQKAILYQRMEDALYSDLHRDGVWIADYRRIQFKAINNS